MNLMRLVLHMTVGLLLSIGATLAVSSMEGKLAADNLGLLFAVTTTIFVGFTLGAFFAPRKSEND